MANKKLIVPKKDRARERRIVAAELAAGMVPGAIAGFKVGKKLSKGIKHPLGSAVVHGAVMGAGTLGGNLIASSASQARRRRKYKKTQESIDAMGNSEMGESFRLSPGHKLLGGRNVSDLRRFFKSRHVKGKVVGGAIAGGLAGMALSGAREKKLTKNEKAKTKKELLKRLAIGGVSGGLAGGYVGSLAGLETTDNRGMKLPSAADKRARKGLLRKLVKSAGRASDRGVPKSPFKARNDAMNFFKNRDAKTLRDYITRNSPATSYPRLTSEAVQDIASGQSVDEAIGALLSN